MTNNFRFEYFRVRFEKEIRRVQVIIFYVLAPPPATPCNFPHRQINPIFAIHTSIHTVKEIYIVWKRENERFSSKNRSTHRDHITNEYEIGIGKKRIFHFCKITYILSLSETKPHSFYRQLRFDMYICAQKWIKYTERQWAIQKANPNI